MLGDDLLDMPCMLNLFGSDGLRALLKDLAKGEIAGDDSHSYIVRAINYRYEIRQVNDSDDEILHTTNCKDDGVKYVEQYTSAHSDLFMYDLKKGIIVTTSTP